MLMVCSQPESFDVRTRRVQEDEEYWNWPSQDGQGGWAPRQRSRLALGESKIRPGLGRCHGIDQRTSHLPYALPRVRNLEMELAKPRHAGIRFLNLLHRSRLPHDSKSLSKEAKTALLHARRSKPNSWFKRLILAITIEQILLASYLNSIYSILNLSLTTDSYSHKRHITLDYESFPMHRTIHFLIHLMQIQTSHCISLALLDFLEFLVFV